MTAHSVTSPLAGDVRGFEPVTPSWLRWTVTAASLKALILLGRVSALPIVAVSAEAALGVQQSPRVPAIPSSASLPGMRAMRGPLLLPISPPGARPVGYFFPITIGTTVPGGPVVPAAVFCFRTLPRNFFLLVLP